MNDFSVLPLMTGVGRLRREPVRPQHLRRVAVYGPVEVLYSHDEEEDNYDVLAYRLQGCESPVAEAFVAAFMQAHRVTLKELVEEAPQTSEI